MIEYKTGDLLAEEADALVNTVNCVGHMGAGIVLQFKKAWPENFRAYAGACRDSEVQPGRMFTYETNQLAPPRYIINFPTKRHWRGRSRLKDIDAGLVALAEEFRRLGLKIIAVPPLGASLGDLSWNQVRPRIERALGVFLPTSSSWSGSSRFSRRSRFVVACSPQRLNWRGVCATTCSSITKTHALWGGRRPSTKFTSKVQPPS